MTPIETLTETLAAWQPHGPGLKSWSHAHPEGGWDVNLTADRSDSVGCVTWELKLQRTNPAPAGLTTRGWADRIATRVTGLLEPLKIIEVDDAGAEAILRSATPSKRGSSVGYYEVALTGTEKAVVRRFQADVGAGTPRTQVGYALTHEVLAKLVDDIVRD